MTCFGMEKQISTVISEQCPCCCESMKPNYHSKSIQISNVDNCNCVKSHLPVSNIEQVNLPITENGVLDKIAATCNKILNIISFKDKKSSIHYHLDYRTSFNDDLNILRTVIRLI